MKNQQSRIVDTDGGKAKQIGDIISDLKESPLFNLSLASKELFHSNFIAWILEIKGVNSSALLKLLFNDLVTQSDFKEAEREISNFDIRVWLENGDNVVVENKVKSLPSKEQLDKYSASLEKQKSALGKTTCILLSLTKPDFFSDEATYKTESNYDWRFVSYEDLAIALEEIVESAAGYHKELIKDYIKFINNLCSLYGKCKGYEGNEAALIDGDLYKKLQVIRLHDIYGKWRVEALKNLLETKYKTKLEGIILTTDYGSGGGILNIDPKNISGARKWKKIQIQSGQLRQVLQYKGKGNSKIFKEAHDLMKNEEWFFLPKKGWHGSKCNNEEPRNDYGFCKYGKDDKVYFSYRYETEWDIARIIELAKDVKIIKE